MRALALLLLLAAAARADEPLAVLHGVVIDARNHKPLDEAVVDLCRHAPVDPPVGWEAPARRCGVASRAPLTDDKGRFELPLWDPVESLPPEARIVVERIGFLRRTVDRTWLLAAIAKKTPAYIAMVPAANLRGEVRPDGAAAAWITVRPRTLRYGRCPVGSDGRFDCEGAIEPGEVIVYSLESGRIGSTRVKLKSGEEKQVTVELRDPIFQFSGTVVGDDGQPLAAIIDAQPVEISAATLIDRVLLHQDSGATSLDGEFGFTTASRAPVRVRISTWTQAPLEPSHTGERLLAETVVTPGQPPARITLRASGPPLVSCTAVGADGVELPIVHLGVRLLDLTHDARTHGERCFGTFAAPPTRQARFFWPEPAQRIEVRVFAEDAGDGGARRRLQGRLELAGASTPCRIPVAP